MKYEKWLLWVSLKNKYHLKITMPDVLLLCSDTDLSRAEFDVLIKDVMKNEAFN